MAEKEYIERGALIAEIDRNEPSNWTDTEAEIQSILDYRLYKGIAISQPTADVVEVRHGEWKKVYQNKIATVYECSNCQHLSFGTSEYCICGAKMDGERKCANE